MLETILDFKVNSPRNKKPRSTTFPEAEKRGGNSTLGRVFSLIFEVFGKVVKHGIACFDISSQSRLKPRRNGETSAIQRASTHVFNCLELKESFKSVESLF